MLQVNVSISFCLYNLDRFIFYLCRLLPSSGSQIGKTGDKVYMRKNGSQHKMKQNIIRPYNMNVKVKILFNLESEVFYPILYKLSFPSSLLFFPCLFCLKQVKRLLTDETFFQMFQASCQSQHRLLEDYKV